MTQVADSLFDLTGKVAIVTGSTKGIGRAIAVRMAQHGAKVVVSSRKAEVCEEVAGDIRSGGGNAFARSANIGRKADLQGLVDDTVAHWGGVDILVCNAAVNPYYGPSLDCPDEAFERVMGSNVRSTFWLCNMVLPQMAERGGGTIIVISSIAALRGTPVIGAYGISKAADAAIVRNLAVEWGARNIRANCIAPGLVRTDFARALWEDPEVLRHRVKDSPLPRIGEPDEIAGAAVFLASAAGSFATGQTFVIDGGVTIAGSALG
jgi:NAD(P)-dependent dehydrogenase (short-subunit alcohol dehydrogenase family)